jgi:hypothetical protein
MGPISAELRSLQVFWRAMARRLDFSNDNAHQGRASTSVGGTARRSPHYRLVFAPSHDPS